MGKELIEKLAGIIQKAKDKGDDMDYENDEEFMKKHKAYMKKMGAGKNMDGKDNMKKSFEDILEKAVSEIDSNSDSVVVMDNASEIIKSFNSTLDTITKAFSDMVEKFSERFETIEKALETNQELSLGSAEVLAKSAETIELIGGKPLVPGAIDNGAAQEPNPSNVTLLEKAKTIGLSPIYKGLGEMVNNGNDLALHTVTALETARGNINRLTAPMQAQIAKVVQDIEGGQK